MEAKCQTLANEKQKLIIKFSKKIAIHVSVKNYISLVLRTKAQSELRENKMEGIKKSK